MLLDFIREKPKKRTCTMQKRISASFYGFVLSFMTKEVWNERIDTNRGLCTGLIGSLELQLPGHSLHYTTKQFFLPGKPRSTALATALLEFMLVQAENGTLGNSGHEIVGDMVWHTLKRGLKEQFARCVWQNNMFFAA